MTEPLDPADPPAPLPAPLRRTVQLETGMAMTLACIPARPDPRDPDYLDPQGGTDM